MNEKRNNSQPHTGGGMALGDIYYVLFRHKWKIVTLSGIGLAVALGIFFFRGTTYQSEADIWIKYVPSAAPQGPVQDPGQNIMIGTEQETIINNQVANLNSFDLALTVATNIGPDKILALAGGGSDKNVAASYIHDNLIVERIPKSTTLRLVFSHPDKDLVQRILQQIVDSYKDAQEKHYTSVGSSFEVVNAETTRLKKELDQTQNELNQAKAAANVSDLPEAKKTTQELYLQTIQQIQQAQAELHQHETQLKKLKDAVGDTSASVASANPPAEIPQDKIDEYTDNNEYIDQLKKKYYDLRAQYPPHSTFVTDAQDKLDAARAKKKELEKAEPRLAKMRLATTKSPTQSTGPSIPDLITAEEVIVASLQEKINSEQTNMEQFHAAMTNLDALAPAIIDLEQRAENQGDYYKKCLSALEEKRINDSISGQADASIDVTQSPRPPTRERSKTPKMMGIAALAGIIAGLAWAFFLELYLDHSVRRPKEIEGNLGMRLFLSIPDVQKNGARLLGNGLAKKGAGAKNGKAKGLISATSTAAVNGEEGGETANGAAAANGANGANDTNGANGKLEIAPWDHSHSLHNYYEALRDRLISYFEVNNLNHKPKLVAVTGSSTSCGTTTIAAGLAASLSETGDGNVLLIDMNLEHGAAQQFYKGKPSCELDAALANETRDNAMVQNNLYVVSGKANGDQLSRMLPKRFANLLPKLKASDYDYIIFDMPPIARTGVTQRLAGFMDMMLLVVEAEKTSRDVVRQAGALLTESKANVSVVLNKTRTYIPSRFHQEF